MNEKNYTLFLFVVRCEIFRFCGYSDLFTYKKTHKAQSRTYNKIRKKERKKIDGKCVKR